MAKKAAAKKAVIPAAPEKSLKDLAQDRRLEILEKYLGKSLDILANHFGGECAALKSALDCEIKEALASVEKKA